MTQPNDESCCPIVELRQYTLHPGRRDELIELFEREFVETQESVGMRIIGTFRDLDNPNRFVWLRGFADMESRADQLARFYGGPVWKAHREAANVTMIDSDNVLLLRRATAQSGFDLTGVKRRARGSIEGTSGLIAATIYHLENDPEEFARLFEENVAPGLREASIPLLATFVTEQSPNSFPALPVREDANVFVWFTRVADRSDYERVVLQLQHSVSGANREVLFLAPTARSLLRG